MKRKKKKKKSTKRLTGRKEHLHFNGLITKGLLIGCPILTGSALYIFITRGRLDLIQWWWIAGLLLTPFLYRLHEIVASPDMDDTKRKGFLGWYWKPYAKCVRHRGICSHTLLIGSPLRFGVAYAIPLLILVVALNWQLVDESNSTLYIVTNLDMPRSVGLFIAWWFGVCVLSDLSHLLCDRMFSPLKVLLLGDP